MKLPTSKNQQILDKENKYFKLYKFLYEQNMRNRKKNAKKGNIAKYNKINFFEENEKFNESKTKKPITVEHYINEEKFFSNKNNLKNFSNRLKDEYDLGIYYNGDYTISRSNDGKSNSNEFYEIDNNYNNNINEKNKLIRNYSMIMPKTPKLQFNSLKNNLFNNRINNKNNNYIYKRKSLNSSLNYDNNSLSLYYYKNNNNNNNNDILSKRKYFSNKKIREKRDINLFLVPKRILNRINDKNIFYIENKKLFKNSISSNELSKRNYKDSLTTKRNKKVINKDTIFDHKNKLFKKENQFNDMNQINRFRKIRKDLSEERIKINNMMSEFFKNPLFIKFNHKDIILDINKQKNALNRPKSAMS